MSIEEPTAETRFIPALLALVGDAARGAVGVSLTWTYFKLRGKSAFSRDTQEGLHGDQEHYVTSC
jgi:hypothetical protein